MTPSHSSSTEPENDVFAFDPTFVPERENKAAATTSITFDNLLPTNTPLLLHEDLQEGCGGQLWPAGMVLSKYMLTYHKTGSLPGKSIIEIGAGGGLVGLAVALGCEVDSSKPIYITDQIPMLALMQKNIALNNLHGRVQAEVYDWGTPPPESILAEGEHPQIVLAADCVYFEPAFPLLLKTLKDLIGPATMCYFCFKKRRKADMRFIRDMMKTFDVEQVVYDGREADQPSLDQYRESIHTSVVKDLENVEKALVTGLEELTVDLDHHFDDLANIEEPLQKPFDTETLSIQPKPGPKQQAQEVLLQDRITAFRKLREEKEKILCKLWEDWEDIQFRLIGLAAEVLGQDTLAFAQVRDEDMKPGQREKLENALEAAQKIFDANGDPHDSLAQDLEVFEENVGQIASKTKSTVSELQQQYNVQKNKLFKGLHRHIELLAAL